MKLFRQGVAGWNQSGVDGVLSILAEDVIAYPFPEWPADSIYRGRKEFRKLAAEWTEQFDEYSWKEERAIAVGDDVVVGLVYHQGHIRGSEVPIKQPMGTIWKIKDGEGIEVHFFLTWKEALDAAGLSE